MMRSSLQPALQRALLFYFPLFLVFILKSPFLIFNNRMYLHDTLKRLPFFSYYIDGYRGWIPPLWSPFTHSGEPFYFYIPICGLLSPGTSLTLIFHNLSPQVPVIVLHHWALFIDLSIFLLGSYLFFSCIARNFFALVLANVAISTSMVALSLYRQILSLQPILFLPWIFYFAYRYFIKKERVHVLPLALALGLQANNYIPVYISVYLVITLLSLLLGVWISAKLNRDSHSDFKRSVKMFFRFQWLNKGWVAAGLLVLALFAVLPLSLLAENKEIYPISRMASGSVVSEVGVDIQEVDLKGSTPLYLEGVFTSLFPLSFLGQTDEMPVYIGSIPFLFALIGLYKSRNIFTLGMSVSTLVLVVLALGTDFGLSSFFYEYFPGFAFIRHMSPFSAFICFNLVILAIYGVDYCLINLDLLQVNLQPYLNKGVLIFAFVGFMVVFLLAKIPIDFNVWMFNEIILQSVKIELALVFGLILFVFWTLTNFRRKTACMILLSVVVMEAFLIHDPLDMFYSVSRRLRFSVDRHSVLAKHTPPEFKFNLTRQWVLPPLEREVPVFDDWNYTFGESMLFYQDSAFIQDNNKFHLLRNYNEYLVNNILNYKLMTYVFQQPPVKWKEFKLIFSESLEEDLGITQPKIQFHPERSLKGMRVSDYQPNSVDFEIPSGPASQFIYKDVYHKYWKAYLNGKPVDITEWKGLMKRVELGVGTHHLRFEFMPPVILFGILYGVSGSMVFLVVVGFCLRDRREASRLLQLSPRAGEGF